MTMYSSMDGILNKKRREIAETNVNLLKEGLITIAHSEDVEGMISSPHGVKYVIDGLLKTPDAGSIKMRTVWIIDKGQVRPRFVTAYPI